MSNGDYKKLAKPGDPLDIPAAAFNSWQRAAAIADPLARKETHRGGGIRREGIYPIQNNSGADRQAGEVLGISGVLVGPNDYTADPTASLAEFQYNFALTGVVPTAASYTGKFAICYEPIASGDIGRAYVDGVCPVKIGSADTSALALDVTDGDATHLSTNGAGCCQVLAAISSADVNGDYWAIVRFLAVLPPGGTARQPLQRDDNDNAVWDDVMTP